MNAAVAIAPTSAGSLEISRHSEDRVLLRVTNEDGTEVARGTACANVMLDLCLGSVSALSAGDICFARTADKAIQLRVIHGRYSARIQPEVLESKIERLLIELGHPVCL